MKNVAVIAANETLQIQAELLAEHLRLPLINKVDAESCLLRVTEKRLELRLTAADAPGPVYAEFISGPAGYRRLKGGGRKQHIARAVGVKGKNPPSVIDATAGLGRDSFVLAALGCRVQMVEQSPIIAALLKDGLLRAMQDPATNEIIRQKLTLHVGNSWDYLMKLTGERPDVVYLDPMYPAQSKQALGKKEMRLLKEIVGDDLDSHLLLQSALKVATKRVVVKRPRKAESIKGPEPDFAVTGKSSRFDVYLISRDF